MITKHLRALLVLINLFKISFRLVPCLKAIVRLSRFMKQIRQKAQEGMIIEEKDLAWHCMALDFSLAQETSLVLFLIL